MNLISFSSVAVYSGSCAVGSTSGSLSAELLGLKEGQ